MVIVFFLGGAYYEFFYHPARYGKNIIALMEEMQKRGPPGNEKELEGLDEVARSAKVMDVQKAYFLEFKEKISRLWPPFFGERRQLHNDLQLLLGKMIASLEETKKQNDFLSGAARCKTAWESTNSQDQSNAKTRDIQQFFERFIAGVKEACGKFTSAGGSVPTTGSPTFEELKIEWEKETVRALDTILAFWKAQNPDLLLRQLDFSKANKEVQEATASGDKFKGLLDAFLRNVRPDQFSPEQMFASDPETKAANERVNKTMEELKKKYGSQQ